MWEIYIYICICICVCIYTYIHIHTYTHTHIYAMEYYLIVKKTEVLIHATTGSNIENIMLTKRSQAQKATYYIFPSIWDVQERQTHRNRN